MAGRSMFRGLMVAAVLALAACQAAPPPVEAASAPPEPPKPVKVAVRPARPRMAAAPCLSADRKQELFRQFAALQDGDGPPPAPPTPAPPPPGCRQAEK